MTYLLNHKDFNFVLDQAKQEIERNKEKKGQL